MNLRPFLCAHLALATGYCNELFVDPVNTFDQLEGEETHFVYFQQEPLTQEALDEALKPLLEQIRNLRKQLVNLERRSSTSQKEVEALRNTVDTELQSLRSSIAIMRARFDSQSARQRKAEQERTRRELIEIRNQFRALERRIADTNRPTNKPSRSAPQATNPSVNTSSNLHYRFGIAGRPVVGGLIITEVMTKSPARALGLKEHDTITSVSGRTGVTWIKDMEGLTDVLKRNRGSVVVRFKRKGERYVSSAIQIVGSKDRKTLAYRGTVFAPQKEPSYLLGISCLTFFEGGLGVTSVAAGSAAEAVGLQKQDIVLRIEGVNRSTKIEDTDDSRLALSMNGGLVRLVFKRDDIIYRTSYIQVPRALPNDASGRYSGRQLPPPVLVND